MRFRVGGAGNGDVAPPMNWYFFWPCLAPFFFLCITRLLYPPPAKSGYKKSASFPTRLGLGFGVVVSWISPWFVMRLHPVFNGMRFDSCTKL